MTDVLVIGAGGRLDAAPWPALVAARPSWRIVWATDLDALDAGSARVVVIERAAPAFQRAALAAAVRNLPVALRVVCCEDAAGAGQFEAAHQVVPPREGALLGVVSAALVVAERLRTSPGLAAQFAQLRDVPSPPAVYFELREQLAAPDGTRSVLAAVAARDPALVARVLKVVNSGFFALPQEVADLPTAIGLLGGDNLLALVLSTRLYSGLPPPGLNLDALWQHAAEVSRIAAEVARSLGADRARCNAAAVAGLLHDLGLLVLLQNEPARYAPLWRAAAGDEHRLVALERDTFGFDHGELGALVLQLWCLPEAVIDAVRDSHSVSAEAAIPPTAIVSRAVLAAEWLMHAGASPTSEVAPAALAIDPALLRDLRANGAVRPSASRGAAP